jgi:hypothetical protein
LPVNEVRAAGQRLRPRGAGIDQGRAVRRACRHDPASRLAASESARPYRVPVGMHVAMGGQFSIDQILE